MHLGDNRVLWNTPVSMYGARTVMSVSCGHLNTVTLIPAQSRGAGSSLSFFSSRSRNVCANSSCSCGLNEPHIQTRAAFHDAVDAQPKWVTDPRFGTFLHYPPV